MLKCAEDATLKRLLHSLDIPVRTTFDPVEPCGYYHTDDPTELLAIAEQRHLHVNQIADHELILSSVPVWLGRAKLRRTETEYVRTLYSRQEWHTLRETYARIRHIPCVPVMTFSEPLLICMPIWFTSRELHHSDVDSGHKQLFLRFLRGMHSAGFVHRDLHCRNILVRDDELRVIDWDFVTAQRCPITESYDLTGTGLESPHLTRNSHIFKEHPHHGIPSVAEHLGITWSDFACQTY